MGGNASLWKDQSTHDSDAIASLKAILKRYRFTDSRVDGSNQGRGAAKERVRNPTAISTDNDDDLGTQPMPGSAMETKNKDGLTAKSTDTISQSQPYAAQMKDHHSILSPSSLSQSEDAFTSDLSAHAARELSLLCARYTRLKASVPQIASGPRDPET